MDDEPCTIDVQGTLCDEPISQVCVPKVAGSFDYRLCMLYCPGGTMLPLAKPYFYISKAQAATTIQNPGVTEYKPVIESCLPASACLNAACLEKFCASLAQCLQQYGLLRMESNIRGESVQHWLRRRKLRQLRLEVLSGPCRVCCPVADVQSTCRRRIRKRTHASDAARNR